MMLACFIRLYFSVLNTAAATAEDGDGLTTEVGTLECLQTVVPVILQFACAPCRSTEDQVLVSGHDVSCQVLYVQGLADFPLHSLLHPFFPQSSRLPLYKEILRFLTKLRKKS